MSYFNADQLDHMTSLAAIPHESKCWCGWVPLGQCPHCPTDVTTADKLRARCDGCHNDPGPDYGRSITHRIGCERARDRRAIDLRLIDLGGES